MGSTSFLQTASILALVEATQGDRPKHLCLQTSSKIPAVEAVVEPSASSVSTIQAERNHVTDYAMLAGVATFTTWVEINWWFMLLN
jgi:hypothetical protein